MLSIQQIKPASVALRGLIYLFLPAWPSAALRRGNRFSGLLRAVELAVSGAFLSTRSLRRNRPGWSACWQKQTGVVGGEEANLGAAGGLIQAAVST